MLDRTVKRSGDRAWWDQLDRLVKEGYRPVLNGLDAQAAESTRCPRCGHRRMEYRGFSIAGVVNRWFALCDMCEHWFEF